MTNFIPDFSKRPMGFRPMPAAIPFDDAENFDPTYTKTNERCKKEWKNSRFYEVNKCMKYFPQKVSFTTAWKKCQEGGLGVSPSVSLVFRYFFNSCLPLQGYRRLFALSDKSHRQC